MRHVLIDPRKLQAIVDHAEECVRAGRQAGGKGVLAGAVAARQTLTADGAALLARW
jgi:hypothetical protein